MVVVNGPLEQSLEADLFEVRSVEHPFLSDQSLESPFLDGLHQNIFFNAVLSDEPIDGDVSGLADPMAPILCLFVHSWVPVSIVEDDIARPRQVEADAPRASTADEAENPGVVVEALDDGLPQLSLGGAVESDVVELEHVEDLLEDVEHLGHLSEDQHLLSPVLDGPEQEDHLDELTTVVEDDVLVREVQQEAGPDALQLAGYHRLDLVAEVLEPVGLCLHL